MITRKSIACSLASAFVAGSLDVEGLVDRGSRLLGKRWRWLHPLARRIAQHYAGKVRPRKSTIERFILGDRGFWRACKKHDLRLPRRISDRPRMAPIAAASAWYAKRILSTTGELAEWLEISAAQLDWLADLRRLTTRQNSPQLQHYRFRVHAKKFGQYRLIEAPKPRLKAIQRKILTEILDHIPPHEAAHGFRLGRSIVTFAAPHVGQEVVIKLDLQDFFPSIRVVQIQAMFRSLGYPETVADLLAGLCTTSTPADVLNEPTWATPSQQTQHQKRRYAQRHLPQGAPTSPAIANLCAYRLDCRLAGLAAASGATYTRYADDLAFSGDVNFQRAAKRFPTHAAAIVLEEGYAVHHRKTRIMRQGVRQRIAGLVVNQHLNLPREDFDRMKAILTNCVRQGTESQNRARHENFRAHLEGKVSFFEMVSPEKGRRLRGLLDQIAW